MLIWIQVKDINIYSLKNLMFSLICIILWNNFEVFILHYLQISARKLKQVVVQTDPFEIWRVILILCSFDYITGGKGALRVPFQKASHRHIHTRKVSCIIT